MTTLRLLRTELATALGATLGTTFKVFPDPVSLADAIGKPTVVLERSGVQKLPEAPLGFLVNSLALIIISPKQNDEDYLDDLLDEVLEALDDTAHVDWTEAARSVYRDQYPAYTITLSAHSNRKA